VLLRRKRSPIRLFCATGRDEEESYLSEPPPSGPLPLVSVIVACYGQLAYTQDLTASLEQHAGTPYELILVDNGCPERTADWAEARGIRTVRMGRNAGVAAAYNAGVRVANGGIIALWNNDMVCHPGGLERLARWSLLKGMAAQTGGVWNAHGEYAGLSAAPCWSDYAEGYCLTFPRHVWDRVGPWSLKYWPSYGDDVDWELRARMLGFDFVLVPDCVTHFGQKTSGTMELTDRIKKHQGMIREKYLPLGLGQRLLVKRWAAVGDVMMATPAMRALKAEAPLARLHVCTHAGPAAVLKGLPYVDHVTSTTPDEQRYSRVVDLNDAYEDDQKRGAYRHPTRAYCQAASVEFDGRPYDLRLTDAEVEWAAEALPHAGYQFIAAGVRSGTRPKQNWNAKRWVELADSLPASARLVVLDSEPQPVLGPHGAAAADRRFYAHPRVIDLTGRTPSFRHATAILARCERFVGVDSGLLHAAAALGLPVVCVCAAAPLEARLPLVGTAFGFEGKADCFPCQYRTPCPVSSHCLDYVTGSMVAEALRV
jgi:ADP-heptose:LPS heptosyltransferase